MRSRFWKAIVAGSVIGAAAAMLAGGKKKKSFLSQGSGRVGSKTRRMIKGVSKTVNNLMK
jgi:gas vesicle protein